MEVSIKLDAESFAGIASAAIFDHLSDEARGDIIKQAIEYLLTPDKSRISYGSDAKSPLQMAFDQALHVVASKVVREKIENDPDVKAEIEKILSPMVLSAIDVGSENYDTSLADAIGGAVGNWLFECARLRKGY